MLNNKNDTPNSALPRTSEADNKQSRKEYMAQYYAANKEEIAARRNARLEERNATDKNKYATDPAIREQRLKTNAKGRQAYKERITTDPDAKKKHEERLAERRKRHKERLANDPAYRQKRDIFNAAQREKRRKQKSEGDEP